jgi:hypothetical protein
MWHLLFLATGGAFLICSSPAGYRLLTSGVDIRGRAPITRPLFLLAKAAMGLLWAMALWRAGASLGWKNRCSHVCRRLHAGAGRIQSPRPGDPFRFARR